MEASKTPMCRDRYGPLAEEQFNIRSCALCFGFLFTQNPPLAPLPSEFLLLVPTSANTTSIRGPIKPDARNDTLRELICSELNADECERWTSCCEHARTCCSHQLSQSAMTQPGHCPRNWDGFSCWADTTASTTVTTACPKFMEHSIQTQKAIKQCTANGTWYTRQGLSWTDYRPCLDKESYVISVYISLACNIISIAFLFPSIVIFFIFRELLKQHRIRLHINFFLSLLLGGIVNILWFTLVHHDTLVNPVSSQTALYRNPVWCRVLSFFKMYLTGTNYFWMFCEGYYLHRLISKAFEPPKNLAPLYLFGWGTPALPTLAYSIVRGYISNERCWVKNIGAYQWIIYIPNLLCLVINTIFLCNILRILLFQMHSHPHEPSNFRRGLKAALMLVPLFGLQLFLTIYRPPPEAPGAHIYEYINIVIVNSQGVFVSLIFCMFNGEVFTSVCSPQARSRCQTWLHSVINNMKKCPCCRRYGKKLHTQMGNTSVTQVTTYEDRRSPTISHRSPAKITELEMEEFGQTNGQLWEAEGSPNRKGYIAVPSNGKGPVGL